MLDNVNDKTNEYIEFTRYELFFCSDFCKQVFLNIHKKQLMGIQSQSQSERDKNKENQKRTEKAAD